VRPFAKPIVMARNHFPCKLSFRLGATDLQITRTRYIDVVNVEGKRLVLHACTTAVSRLRIMAYAEASAFRRVYISLRLISALMSSVHQTLLTPQDLPNPTYDDSRCSSIKSARRVLSASAATTSSDSCPLRAQTYPMRLVCRS
jgi:hypothetical protein